MKKITLLIAALAMTTGAFAQEWDYGLKAGMNFSKVSKLSGGKAKSLTGFYVGAFAEYRLNNWFGIQPELVYSTQGTRFLSATGISPEWKFELRDNYINVPILAKFYVMDGLSVDFGPQFGFLARNTVKIKSTGNTPAFVVKAKKFDFGVGMGLSYTISGAFDITARYNLGLSDIYDYDGKNRNSVIQFGVGYRF
jgi:opacity protein-like surface antigen